MNSQQLFNAMLAAMVGDDAIDKPEQLDFATPREMGRMDALDGEECDPLNYGYVKVTDCEAYILAYRESAHIEDTDELISYIEDVEWMRGGC